MIAAANFLKQSTMTKQQRKTQPKNLKVKILLPVAGKFGLSHNVGDIHSIPHALAKDIIDSKYGEQVK